MQQTQAEAPADLKQVFISDIGSFIGRHLVKWLQQNRKVYTPATNAPGTTIEQQEEEGNQEAAPATATTDTEEDEIDLGDENAPDEEGQEEDEEEKDEEEEETNDAAGTWKIVGSLNPEDKCPDCVAHVEDLGTEAAVNLAYSSDHIILALARQQQESSAIVGALRTDDTNKKVVIGISTVEVWGRTKKPKNADSLTEEHYRRRKPPSDLQDVLTLETHLQSLKKKNLRCHIIGSGLLYGYEQDVLHQLFKESWLCEKPSLKIPSRGDKKGKNALPMIHVSDFCSIVGAVSGADPEQEYILACDDSQNTLKDVCLAIAKTIGPGMVEHVDEAKADQLISQHPQFQSLQVCVLVACSYVSASYGQCEVLVQINLKFDMSSAAIQNMEFEWKAKEGLVETMEYERKDYIEARNLNPLRLAVLGPPAVGKSFISEKLSSKYSLDIIRARDAIEEIVKEPVRLAKADDTQESSKDAMKDQPEESKGGEEAEDGGEEEDEQAEDMGVDRSESDFASQLRKKVKEVLEEKNRLPQALMALAVRWVVSSPRHRNRGYILDGFPRTYKEAEHLFSEESGEENVDLEALGEEEAEEGGDEEEIPEVSVVQEIAPSGVIIYEATDDTLREKVKQKHAEDEGAEHSEDPVERFERRLKTYRFYNGPDRIKSVDYFFQQQVKVQPLPREVGDHINEHEELDVICPYIERGGRPFNYDESTAEELQQERKSQEAEVVAEKTVAQEEKTKGKKAEAAQKEQAAKEAQQRLQEIARAEAQHLEERSGPVRDYLMGTVVPELTQGLLEASRAQAEDPVEYLAQYLFRRCEPEGEEKYAM